MDGYGLVDLLAYYPLTENLRLNLNLNNLFDKHYEERAWNAWAYPGEPRSCRRGFRSACKAERQVNAVHLA